MGLIGYIIYITIQCTWGIFQTFVGFLFFLYHRREPHDFYRGCIRTTWSLHGGISLGMFIFTPDDSSLGEALTIHEYGHTYQSLLLGPFYIIPGICSLVWSQSSICRKMRQEKGISYYSYWTERWADWLGEKITGLPSMGTRENSNKK